MVLSIVVVAAASGGAPFLLRRGRTATPRVLALVLVNVLLVALLSVAACRSTPPAQRGLDPGLVDLCRHMSGSFSSRAQAEQDADFRDIRLHMVRVWPQEPDAVWLYVEQAAAASLEQPYRQRVYRVAHVGGDLYESRAYEFPDPLRLAGAWHDSGRLALLTRAELEDRQGCAILLRRQPDGSFAGSTLGRLCVSTHRGASYATSEVTIAATRFVSWDRGFDDAGRQVWGAEKGAYTFDKLEEYPLGQVDALHFRNP